ncbi:hypothetical protein [Variovorax sp. DT-64]|uniref:hypothetical protein n=1 Tax=Variovorax sp. DT-64 TaxID=3396160 RepID=UPI003F1E0627
MIVEIAQARRFACQAPGCGRSTFRQLYLVVRSGEIVVLGAGCFRKMQGSEAPVRPLYATPPVRRLNERECRLLAQDPARLIAEIEAQHVLPSRTSLAGPQSGEIAARARIPRLPAWTKLQFGAQAERDVEARYGQRSGLKGWRSLVDLRIMELANGVNDSSA